MKLEIRSPGELLNKAYAQQSPGSEELALFCTNLPIPNATPEQQTPIIELVDQILVARKADPKADTGELEASIDALVYRLYGLDAEERRVVEGRS